MAEMVSVKVKIRGIQDFLARLQFGEAYLVRAISSGDEDGFMNAANVSCLRFHRNTHSAFHPSGVGMHLDT